MSTNGSLERNLKIESMYGIDAMSSDVFDMIGESFNFETPTKFDNLIILWYNEEDQIFEEMPTTRNKAQSTISTKTTHFSQYIVVDSERWYSNWEASFNELREMWSDGKTTYKSMNTVFIVDCSSDMSNGDSRISICQNIMNNMMTNDKAAVITYASGVNSATGFMSPQSAIANLKSNISNIGTPSSLVPAFTKAMSTIYNSDAEMNRIIIVTTSNTQFTFDLDNYNLSGVNVNVIDLGSYSVSQSLLNVTQRTGGGYYNAITADALTYQKGEEIYTPPQFIGEDSDGDGIPDIVEEYGLKPNGQRIGTNKLLKDTDGDGLDDNVELRFSVDNFKNDMDNDNRYYCRALYMATDPTKKDTDGDGFPDNYLESMADKDYYRYTDPNPLKSDVTETSLKNDFFSVDYEYKDGATENWAKSENNNSNISYGGYQGWFGNKYGDTGNDNTFCNGNVSGDLIWSKGCGLIAVADALLYMSLSDSKYTIINGTKEPITIDENGVIDFDDYVLYVQNLSNIFEINSTNGILAVSIPILSDSSIEEGINYISELNEMNINAFWEGKNSFLYSNLDINDVMFIRAKECFKSIKNMLLNDTPVIISYSNDLTIGRIIDQIVDKDQFAKKLTLYTFDGHTFISENNPKIGSHYMNVTGMIEYSDDAADLLGFRTMLEIASYGKKYYIDFDEYKNYIDLVSNIMCMNKN